MAKQSSQYGYKSKKRLLLICGLVFLVIACTVVYLLKGGPFSDDKAGTGSEAKTTSTAKTAQENFTDGDNRPVVQSNKQEGTVNDNNGAVSNIPPQSQWTTSKDGLITTYSPVKNSVLVSGADLTGSSSLSRVYFRLIDDVSGVIAQGSISVVNGKYSGKFSFTTSGTNGRVDVFSAAADGVESSNIEIPVRFK